jgi:hypothetical protein
MDTPALQNGGDRDDGPSMPNVGLFKGGRERR